MVLVQNVLMSDLPPPPPSRNSNFNASWGSPSSGAFTAGNGGYMVATAGQRIWAAVLDGLLMLVTLWIGWFIWSIVLFKQSTSPAKKMMGLQIVDVNTGGPATMQQMLLREILGKWILGSVTGVIHLASAVMIFVMPKRQAVWDFIGSTTVAKV